MALRLLAAWEKETAAQCVCVFVPLRAASLSKPPPFCFPQGFGGMSRSVDHLVECFRMDSIPEGACFADFEFPSNSAFWSTWFAALKDTYFNLSHRWGIERFGYDEWQRVQLIGDGAEDKQRLRDCAEYAADTMQDAVMHGGGGAYMLMERVLEWAEAQTADHIDTPLLRYAYCRKVLAPSWVRPPPMPQPCATCGNSPLLNIEYGLPPAPCACPAPRPLTVRCYVCGTPTKTVCAQCRQRHYCGKGCQAADWRAGHKRTCGKASTGGSEGAGGRK